LKFVIFQKKINTFATQNEKTIRKYDLVVAFYSFRDECVAIACIFNTIFGGSLLTAANRFFVVGVLYPNDH
jgi:hypothetical protein